MPAMCLRFWPEWVWLNQAIGAKTFGEFWPLVFGGSGNRGLGTEIFLDGKLSGGALLDLHIHDTDFVQFCFGVLSASSPLVSAKSAGAIDHVVTQYQVASGASVSAEGSWAMTEGFGFQMSYTAFLSTPRWITTSLARAGRAKTFRERQRPAILGP